MLFWGGIPGGWEWIVILVICLLIFGKKLPDVARSLGKSLTSFKKGLHEVDETKEELIGDVKKAKDDIVNEAKEAAGLDETDSDD
jgi:sec-independent protein translocase protein TatA